MRSDLFLPLHEMAVLNLTIKIFLNRLILLSLLLLI